jgi:hypothetical protein
VRSGGAVILLGGWMLLFNPTPDLPDPPLPTWKKIREYDTAWLCEEGRRKEANDLAQKTAAKPGQSSTVLGPLLRYRCERSERLRAAPARKGY